MAKIRTIKPEFWDDEQIASLPFGCRLLFIGIWNFADDNGIIRSSEKYIKSKVFPYDDNLRLSEIKNWLNELEKNRWLVPVSYKNESYYAIRTFDVHQRIDSRYAKYIIPKDDSDILLKDLKQCGNSVATCDSHAGKERKGVGIGKERNIGDGEEKIFKPEQQKKESPPVAPHPLLTYPIGFSEKFKDVWLQWLQYKDGTFKFRYKSLQTEQAAMHNLLNLADNEQDCISIIIYSMGRQWEGFYLPDELKQKQNGKRTTENRKQPTGANVDVKSAFSAIDEMYRNTDTQ